MRRVSNMSGGAAIITTATIGTRTIIIGIAGTIGTIGTAGKL